MRNTIRTADRVEHKLLVEELVRMWTERKFSDRKVERLLNRPTGWATRLKKSERSLDFATIFDFIRLLGGDIPEVMRRVDEATEAYYKNMGQPRPCPPVED